jgi:3-oxoacyl-(acyl-carrier-protein) synthase
MMVEDTITVEVKRERELMMHTYENKKRTDVDHPTAMDLVDFVNALPPDERALVRSGINTHPQHVYVVVGSGSDGTHTIEKAYYDRDEANDVAEVKTCAGRAGRSYVALTVRIA